MSGQTSDVTRQTRQRIMRCMWEYYAINDYWPTLQEIAEAVGLSATSKAPVRGHLHELAVYGRVRLGPKGTQRTTVLTATGKQAAARLPPLDDGKAWTRMAAAMEQLDRDMLVNAGHTLREPGEKVAE